MKQKTKIFFTLTLILSAVLHLSACTPTIAKRGNLVENTQLDKLTTGQSTRSDVLRTLGSPTTKSTFDSNIWYYIGQETEKRGILDPKVTKERIIMVALDEEGTVENIEDIDRARMSIPYIRDKTPTHGTETTIVQQFLGNLGKFNPPSAE
ncbi:MAG: outer membrane protein assembly factor BamE [Micavibrio sp.]|nr:outer membrane protein assembly factor BamE [Micavibrio sp.]